MRNGFLFAAVLLVLLPGCTTTTIRETKLHGGSLGGTHWRLVSIQSMDDSQGEARPTDPSRYTLDLDADGHAGIGLDCNRGMATWSTDPAKGDSGRLTFGPVAATKALCPSPSLGETLARDLGYVRSFRIIDGRLHLSLMADGGIITYERIGAADR